MPREKTIKASVRYKEDNYNIAKAIADVVYGGDFSKAVNFIIENFRHRNEYTKLLELIMLAGQYEQGVRTREVIKAKKNLDAITLLLTKNHNEAKKCRT